MNVTAVIENLEAAAREKLADAVDSDATYERIVNRFVAEHAQEAAIADLAQITAARRTADEAWRALVAAAITMGAPASQVGEVAGITAAYARQLTAKVVRDAA